MTPRKAQPGKRGPKSRPSSDLVTHRITVRVTASQAVRLDLAADRAGLPVAVYVARAALSVTPGPSEDGTRA